ncbi:MAG: outer membrane protein assembly factor BamD, partial [Candidatus Krumholzibacteria bacterium]|nr:outer membrane protein assembly factor BamD [Candidatus Krumholzibacteria bacterium]
GGPYRASRVELPGQKLAIADDFFKKGKYSKAAVEYKDFLATFAGSERSDFAQFRLAECFRIDEQYSLAAVEYRIVVGDYGYSEFVDDAFFLEGLCAFKQAPRSERDQTKSYKALERVNRFLQLFPKSPRCEEARAALIELHERLGKKDFLSAKLYFSDKRFDAALIYFDKIIEQYSLAVWAERSYYYRGVIDEERGLIDEAVCEYGEAISSANDFPEKEDANRRLKALTSGGISER